MQTLIEQHLGNPLVLALLLFLGPFVLEEAAILAAAALAAAGEMSAALALGAVAVGIVVSDWSLYALGALAGRSRRIRGWLDPAQLARGHRLLHKGAFPAGLLARLIPWLLFPVFVASGFLGVGFRRFALINGMIALVYVVVLFLGALGLNIVLLDWLGNWAWAVAGLLLLAVILGGRWIARRYFPAEDASAE
ncbi:MAG: hypothetical protein FJX25_11800 [Alphaproteobacteria bacterium]|nr:hypothetical protein [Alphaproteobacteria bacterium]